MKTILVTFLFLLSAVTISSFAAIDKNARTEFVILVPSYNNVKWVRRNLDSLTHQKTSIPYSIICIDDCSTDGTGIAMDYYAYEHRLPESFLKIIHNKTRMGALANMYNTIHNHCKDHQVVVIVDGDDFLNHDLILKNLEEEYADPQLWLTYGQFIFYPSARWGLAYEIHRESLVNKEVRSLTYVSQHLRTFRVALFKKIRKEDLMLNGEFYSVNADMATMIPMIEMCAPKDEYTCVHCKFIPDIMYIYNYDNPISDFRVDRTGQLEIENVIRAIKPYEPLDHL